VAYGGQRGANLEQVGNFLFQLKENQPTLREKIKPAFRTMVTADMVEGGYLAERHVSRIEDQPLAGMGAVAGCSDSRGTSRVAAEAKQNPKIGDIVLDIGGHVIFRCVVSLRACFFSDQTE
jgi:hypothetical protein